MKNYIKFSFVFVVFLLFLLIIGYFVFFRGISEAGNIDSEANMKNSVTEGKTSESGSTGAILDSGLGSSSGASAGGGSGGSGGGSSGGSEQVSSSGCSEIQIAYAVKNLTLSQNCVDFLGGECQKKEVSCLANVYNLDYSVSGDFEVNFLFFDKSNQENIITEGSERKLIGPRQNLLFETAKEITGANADFDIGCSFETLSVPKKQVCS